MNYADLAERLQKAIRLRTGLTKSDLEKLVAAKGTSITGVISTLPHLTRQVEKKGLVAHFFVHRDTAPGRGPGKHRLAMTCLLINMETPENLPPLIVAKGIAFCHYRDQWNAEKGKELSLQRALRAYKHQAITDSCRLTDLDLLAWAASRNLIVERDGKQYVCCNRGIGLGPIQTWGPEKAFMQDLRKPEKEEVRK